MLRKRLTFANVMSSLAVFIALGGSAVALKANSVGSRQIRDDSIKGRDVRDGRLKGKDLAPATIGAREIEEAALDLGPLVKMGSASGGCDPGSTAFVSCASVTLGTQQPSRALLVAGGGQHGGAGADGTCKFRINGSDDPLNLPASSFGDPQQRDAFEANGIALTAVSDKASPIPPGVNNFRLVCNETGGNVAFDTTLSVVALGGGAG